MHINNWNFSEKNIINITIFQTKSIETNLELIINSCFNRIRCDKDKPYKNFKFQLYQFTLFSICFIQLKNDIKK